MKIMMVVAVLMMSACAGAPAKMTEPALVVSGPSGEVLRVQGNGKIRWAVKRDEAARVMIGLLLKSKEDLDKALAELSKCKNPAGAAKAKK